MNCSPFDLKDYFFGELPVAERSATESHLAGCPECRQELTILGDTRALLFSLSDEEPTRRIAFVSDKVFEPRWWQRLWRSGPQTGFAAAAMLALAIMIHGFAVRPAPLASQAPPAIANTQAVQAEIERRVEARLSAVLNESESRQTERMLQVVNAKARQLNDRRTEDLLLIREYLERADKHNLQVRKAMYDGQ